MSKPSKPRASAQEKALTERSVKEWNDYVSRYMPVERQIKREVQALESQQRLDEVRGIANAEALQASAGMDRRVTGQSLAASAGSASGKEKLGLAAIGDTTGTSSGKAQASALGGQRSARLSGEQSLTALARDLPAASIAGTDALAKQSTATLINKEWNDFALEQTLWEAGGALAGAGREWWNAKGKDMFAQKHAAKSTAAAGNAFATAFSPYSRANMSTAAAGAKFV